MPAAGPICCCSASSVESGLPRSRSSNDIDGAPLYVSGCVAWDGPSATERAAVPRPPAVTGVVVKGAQYLERLAKADVIAFDKTGTLTNGVPPDRDARGDREDHLARRCPRGQWGQVVWKWYVSVPKTKTASWAPHPNWPILLSFSCGR